MQNCVFRLFPPSKLNFLELANNLTFFYVKNTREYKCKARFLKGFTMESFEQLAVQYTPMIHKIIRSLNIYKNKDEFYQLALIGLWEATKKFDTSKGDFTNYAYSMIKGKIQNEMTKTNKAAEITIPAKEEFWNRIEDEGAFIPFEEETLLFYCKSSELTENQTKWVLYHFVKGHNINDIAKIEQVSISAVKAWRSGAKDKIRRNYRPFNRRS